MRLKKKHAGVTYIQRERGTSNCAVEAVLVN